MLPSKSVARVKAIQINRAGEFAASASLVANRRLPVANRLELRLQRINIDVRGRLIGQSAKDVHFRDRSATSILQRGTIGRHPKREIGIGGIAICTSA